MWFYKVLASQDIRDGMAKRSRMPSEYYAHYDELMALKLEQAADQDAQDADLAYNDDSAPEG